MKGKFPEILNHPKYGPSAKDLYEKANKLLDEIIRFKWLTAKAIIGLFPANSVGDDIEVYDYKNPTKIIGTVHNLRQQKRKRSEKSPLYSLSDFIMPKEHNKPDFIGFFVTTGGIGAEEIVKHFKNKQDEFNAILVEALADRLAEASAEYIHMLVRKNFWGYSPNENFSNQELIEEKYVGIRPAPGYPACPDHSEKQFIFDILQAEKQIGVSLTEAFAMKPAASISGYYFSHPDSHYFSVGKILKDQVIDYAERKQVPVEQIEKWLAPYLAYNK